MKTLFCAGCKREHTAALFSPYQIHKRGTRYCGDALRRMKARTIAKRGCPSGRGWRGNDRLNLPGSDVAVSGGRL